MISRNYLEQIVKPRPGNVHKKKLGQILLVVGSRTMPGAGILATLGVLRSGAGIAMAAYPKELKAILVKAVPEALHLALPQTSSGSLAGGAFLGILRASQNQDVVVIGPGLTENIATRKLIIKLVRKIDKPLVLDASALNALSKLPNFERILQKRHDTTILSPHEGEMSVLTGLSVREISSQRKSLARHFAKRWNVILILKGENTIIASPDERNIINNTGGPGLATAGTGDILAGVIATFLSQNISRPFIASAAAVHVHGLAGDIATKALGERSVIASDVLECLPKAILTVIKS